MGTDNLEILLSILGVVAGLTLFVLALVFVAVPLFKGVGWGINSIFRFIGWVVMHIFEFIAGVLGDCVRFIGSLLVMLVLLPLVPVNVVIGRWSAAGHFAERFKNELAIGAACVYRAVIRRPLRFLLLDGVLEGLEQRLPDAMAGAPGSDRPSHRMGQFDGYNIVGSLRAGGSGAKLYVAQPDAEKLRKFAGMPDRVVIKAFALTEGSSLPQIVRESRALECAKQLGHVFDHGMDDHRFFYVMPYHPGEHLGVLTRQFHAECGGRGLDRKHLNLVMSYTRDLLSTLTAYHKCGLWHKDVKPENIIVHDDAAHLVDLGLVTPLRSAMTLTTHGTEYFRDPEMVRQALRGVKVHQVDGAKFDIYAAGAVLYFMLENTFPAHGGLSRITMPSPEALRWIVRRSMTEYNQRYETMDDMLRDLAHVMNASDVYAVKPAELPSMGGASAAPASESVDPVTSVINAAGAAVGSAVAAIGAAFGSAAPAEAGAAASAAPAVDQASKAGTGAKPRRPRIVVTNWWTGAYRVEDEKGGDNDRGFDARFGGSPQGFAAAAAGISDAAARGDARMFRQHAHALRHQAAAISQKVGSGAISARRAARDQIRAARQRAREIQSRAHAHRKHVALARHPSVSPWLFVIGFFTLTLLAGGLFFGFLGSYRSARDGASVYASARPGMPLLLVLEGADPADPRVQDRLDRIVVERRAKGFDVITTTADDVDLRNLINQWWHDPKGSADAAIETLLEARNAYGLLHVTAHGDERRPMKNVREQVVYSTRKDASSRRRLLVETSVPDGPAPELPYLLINDHPAKTDPKVEAVVQQALSEYKARGWQLQSNDDVEVDVRKWLPPGKIDAAKLLPPMLHEALAKAEMGGVLRIDALPGDGEPQERVIVTIVHREDVPAPPATALPADAPPIGEVAPSAEPASAPGT